MTKQTSPLWTKSTWAILQLKPGSKHLVLQVHGRMGNDIRGSCHFSGEVVLISVQGKKTKMGAWYHVALSFDKEGGESIKLYLNAELKKHDKFSKESFEDWGDGQRWYLAKANWNDPSIPWYYRRIALQVSLERQRDQVEYGGGRTISNSKQPEIGRDVG